MASFATSCPPAWSASSMRPRKTSARAGGSVPAETDVIEHEVRVNAPPATVFAYFTDPAKMVQWMGVEATLDPRPGGVSRIAVNREAIMVGGVGGGVAHSRVVFSWGWEDERLDTPPASTLVEVS